MPAEPACPICRRPMVASFRPFCSRRCADADLGRWFAERYAIPAAEGEDEGSGRLDRAEGVE